MLNASASLERGPPASVRAALRRNDVESVDGDGGGRGINDGGLMRLVDACVIPKPLPEFCTRG
jgi:hypothetical protein